MAASAQPKVAAELKKRAGRIIRKLAKAYPEAHCALDHDSAFQLLALTILSAQCTDERVNGVAPKLFRKYPTPKKLAAARRSDVEKIIRSLGFFRAKSASLRGMAKAIVEDYGGELPRSLEELVRLPGVGRKTANVVLGTAFGIASGVVVDTHVKRICNLLGLTESKNPEIIERDLMSVVPKKEWIDFSHRLIWHGRRVCVARRPNCCECPLLKNCPRVGLPELARSAKT